MNVCTVNGQTLDFRVWRRAKCGDDEGKCGPQTHTSVERAESQSCPLARYAHHGNRVSSHKYILKM